MLRHRAHLPVAAGLLIVSAGCYTYTGAVQDTPVPGTEVVITLNDRARVDLSASIGPEILQVEGSVVTASDSTFELRIRRTTTIDRVQTTWGGESVTFRAGHVRSVRERRFSPGRTAIMAGSVTASVVAFIATRGLLGFGSGFDNGPGGPDDNNNGN